MVTRLLAFSCISWILPVFFFNFFFEFSLTYDYVDILRLAIVNNLVLFFETHLKTDLIEDFFSILIVMKFVHAEFLL